MRAAAILLGLLPALTMLAVAEPVAAATPFDGVYKGGNTLAGGGGTRCAAAVNFNVVVKDGVFEWRLGNETAPVRVGPDGSFSGQSGVRFINGRIVDGKLTASTTGSVCNYTWSHVR